MIHEEFDTINDNQSYGLNGWFSGFCPSNGIAKRLNNNANGVWGQKRTWDTKYNALKNGKQASEWESLKREVRRLEKEIKSEQQKLAQEKEIASALGLGAFCRKAVSRRKKAEESLRNAENALGQIKGSFQTLERQQRQGIRQANKVLASNKSKLQAIRKEIAMVKKKIAVFKAKRDNKPKPVTNPNPISVSNAKKESIVGKLKENALPIIGGLALVSLLYFKTKKGKRPTAKSVAV